MSEVKANLDAAFEMVGKYREATGQNILSAWLPSLPGEEEACLLARAFNKGCRVDYRTINATNPEYASEAVGTTTSNGYAMRKGSGRIEFSSKEEAAKFAKIFDREAYIGEEDYYYVELPDEVALVAWEFDHGAYDEYVME
jgi:hypothetical protein